MDNEKIKQFIESNRKNNVPDEEILSFLQQKGAIPKPEPVKPDGFLKSIVKDAAETLLVKPAARATEAITRTVAPNSLAAKGFEVMSDTGQGQQLLGIDVPTQKAFGEGGDRQIASDTLRTASYLFPYGKAASAVGGAVGSKIAGNVISGAGGGYLADTGFGLADENKTVNEALTPGLGTGIGAAIPLAGPIIRGAGRATSKVGSKIVEAVIPVGSREAQILQTYKANNPFFKRVGDVLAGTENAPQTAGKTVAEKGLVGTKSGIGVQAKRVSGSLWENLIAPRLDESKVQVDLPEYFNTIERQIIESTPEAGRQKSLLNALDSVREDYSGTTAISLKKLQQLKEGWTEFVPEKFYKGENIAGAAKQVNALLSKEARQTIYKELGDDVKQAYLDYGNLQGLTKMGQVSMTGSKLKGGTGGLVSEILSQTITPIGTIGGQGIYKIGKGIEFIGNIGAKNVGEALGVNLKFPGDAFLDDVTPKLDAAKKNLKNPSNAQGGFVKNPFSQDANLPKKTQTNQIPKTQNKNVISKSSLNKEIKSSGKLSDSMKDQISKELSNYNTTPLTVNGKPLLTNTDADFRLLQLQNKLNNKALTTSELLEAKALFKEVGIDLDKSFSNPTVGKTVDPLINEAKKYKSAEEFLKTLFIEGKTPSQNKSILIDKLKKGNTLKDNTTLTLLRGESGKMKGMQKGGLWFTENINEAKGYGDNIYVSKVDLGKTKVFNDVEDAYFQLTGKEFTEKQIMGGQRSVESVLKKEAEKQGFDSFVLKYGGTGDGAGQNPQVVIFNESKIKDTSQLTDIWKKANKSK